VGVLTLASNKTVERAACTGGPFLFDIAFLSAPHAGLRRKMQVPVDSLARFCYMAPPRRARAIALSGVSAGSRTFNHFELHGSQRER
jgi:hypothetical protein